MYRHPNADTVEVQAQHKLKLRRYQTMRLDEILSDHNLSIGNDVEHHGPDLNGAVHVENIPYTVTRQEVVQFFGRNARLADHWPVHIIMERTTGKTMDCYVEFQTPHDAREAVRRANQTSETYRGPRMGNRQVDVSVSSQDDLLQALFPRVKCIEWDTGVPCKVGRRSDEQWSTGFDGFLRDEELFCVVRHAREPQRSQFAAKVPQRAYESIISTVYKFPWFTTHLYTVGQRNRVFEALIQMVEILVHRLDTDEKPTVGLDGRLVLELVKAGLRCGAFGPRQKHRLAVAGRDSATLHRMLPNYVATFPFDTLSCRMPFDAAALEFYASLLEKGTVSRNRYDGLDNIHSFACAKPYGRHMFVWNNYTAHRRTFEDAIKYEMKILRTLITSGYNNTNTRGHLHHSSLTTGRSSTTQSSGQRRASTSGSDSHSHRRHGAAPGGGTYLP